MNKITAADLTGSEKLDLVIGKDAWQTNDLGGKVPSVLVSDGPVGIRSDFDAQRIQHPSALPSIAYPSFEILGQTWDSELAKLYGNCIGDDCIDRNIDVILGPGIDIKRDPLCGRNFEYLSEDPLLSGTLAASYIEGVQEKHVGTCLKHYCCNNSEYERQFCSSEVDERTLNEIYLRNFTWAFEADPWCLMCSYNLVNGVRMSENKPLYDFAYEHGFHGAIMSDWIACKDAVASINAGMSLIMPYEEPRKQELVAGLKDGTIDAKALNTAAQRIIDLSNRNEAEKKLRDKSKSLTLEQRRQVAYTAALEGCVLLKNDGVLPLAKDKDIVAAGAPFATYFCGGGSSRVQPELPFISVPVKLSELGYRVEYCDAVWGARAHCTMFGNLKGFYDRALEADAIILGVGSNCDRISEDFDQQDISLSREELVLIDSAVKTAHPVILVVYGGGAVDLSEVKDKVSAILYVGYPGECGSAAIADLLAGVHSPSGRLAETFATLDSFPCTHTYRDHAVNCYSEGLDVGYRHFNSHHVPTLYPFGFGLTYTEFSYSDFRVERDGDGFKVFVTVSNVGQHEAADVIQIYVDDLTRCVYRPGAELKSYKRVSLKPGESTTVELALTRDAFTYYNVNYHQFVVHPGLFSIELRRDAETVVCSQRVKIEK